MRWSADVEQADWIGPRLDAFYQGLVTSTVPRGFPAYVRVLHPVEVPNDPDSRGGQACRDLVRWAEVAAWSGVELTPQTPFRVIATPKREPTSPAPWTNGQRPADGTLQEPDALVLLEVLAANTASGMRCWFAVWDGYGWDDTLRVAAAAPGAQVLDPYPLPDIVPSEVCAGPRVRLPYPDYLLFTGEVGDALALVAEKGQTPNLWWPRTAPGAWPRDRRRRHLRRLQHRARRRAACCPRLETQPAHEGEPALSQPAR